MKLYFTGIFELFTQENCCFLINKKLDTIIPINKSLYKILRECNEGKEIDYTVLSQEILNILIFNRVVGVVQ